MYNKILVVSFAWSLVKGNIKVFDTSLLQELTLHSYNEVFDTSLLQELTLHSYNEVFDTSLLQELTLHSYCR